MRKLFISILFLGVLGATAADTPKPAPAPVFPEVEALQLEKIQLQLENLELQIRLMQQQAREVLDRGYRKAAVDSQAFDVDLQTRNFVAKKPTAKP